MTVAAFITSIQWYDLSSSFVGVMGQCQLCFLPQQGTEQLQKVAYLGNDILYGG